jgi:hypothetical protein
MERFYADLNGALPQLLASGEILVQKRENLLSNRFSGSQCGYIVN